MKDVAFVIVLVLAIALLFFLTCLQMASQSLRVALVVSFTMGLVASFLSSMVVFTVEEDFDMNVLYKILFLSQVGAGMTTAFLRL